MRCVAIDDEPLALNLIRGYAEKVPALKMVATFDDAIAGAEFLRQNPVDILFLDINMPDISGLQLLHSLQEKPPTIFTTAYKKFAFDAYEFEAIDYLLKPIEFDRFLKAVNKAQEYKKNQENQQTGDADALFVRSEYQLVKIELDKVEYVESMEDYLKFHFTTGAPLMTLMTFKALMQKLPERKFVRIHRSYVVPLSRIKSLVNSKVKLTNVELPVSASYIDDLKARLK